MANMVINEIHLKQFKCFGDSDYKLSKRTDVVGRNGSGKTSIGMGLVLPFTGKDLYGRSNPEVHPDFMAESEPHITLNCTIDRKPVVIEWFQTDIRTKRQKEEGAPVRIANKFRINSVDMSQSAFKKKMLEYGIDLDEYEKLTSTSYFGSLKEADKRALIFQLANNDLTDSDICKQIDAPELLKELANFDLTEVEAMQKNIKREASNKIDSLPEQIKGLESAKPTDDFSILRENRKIAENAIKDLQDQIDSFTDHSAENAKILDEIRKLNNKFTEAVTAENFRRASGAEEARTVLADTKQKCREQSAKVQNLEFEFNRKRTVYTEMVTRKNDMLAEYAEKKKEKFPADKKICPTCGQALPQDQVQSRKAEWEENHKNEIDDMAKRGNSLAKDISVLAKNIEDEESVLNAEREKLYGFEEEVRTAEQKLQEASNFVRTDGSDLEECKSILREVEALKNRIYDDSKDREKIEELKNNIGNLQYEISELDKQLGRESVIASIDAQIAEKQEEQREAAQNLANAEHILYQIQMLNMKKNELLSESVNRHFHNVRFKLFRTQKNGEVVNCCIPEVRSEDGKWKDYYSIANNALRVMADIEILAGLQEFYCTWVPIVVDNAESMDIRNRMDINADTQVITLSVSEDDLTIKNIL